MCPIDPLHLTAQHNRIKCKKLCKSYLMSHVNEMNIYKVNLLNVPVPPIYTNYTYLYSYKYIVYFSGSQDNHN